MQKTDEIINEFLHFIVENNYYRHSKIAYEISVLVQQKI